MTQKVSLLWSNAIIVDHSRINKNKKANKNKLGLKGVVSKRQTKIQGKSLIVIKWVTSLQIKIAKKERNHEANVVRGHLTKCFKHYSLL